MKLSVDPTTKFRTGAEDAVNEAFNGQAGIMIQQDQEHSAKRDIAKIVLAGGDPTAEFTDEAALMNVTVQALATTILAKPDEVMARGLRRRTAVLAIRSAASVDAIQAILTSNGISGLKKDLLARQL